MHELVEVARRKGFEAGRSAGRVEANAEAAESLEHAADTLHMQYSALLGDLTTSVAQEQRRVGAAAAAEGATASAAPACDVLQAALIACYQRNPNRPLDCSDEVKAFGACALRARERYVHSLS